jgi:hypothetical protein
VEVADAVIKEMFLERSIFSLHCQPGYKGPYPQCQRPSYPHQSWTVSLTAVAAQSAYVIKCPVSRHAQEHDAIAQDTMCFIREIYPCMEELLTKPQSTV